MQKQFDLIKGALNDLGCEEAPPGCDISIENQNFISNASEQVNSELFAHKTVLVGVGYSVKD